MAAMLQAAEAHRTGESLPAIGWNETSSLDDDKLVQIMLVAGARNTLYLDFCWTAA